MFSKKVFFGAIVGLVALAVLFGGVLPWLISAKSGIAVTIGLGVILALVVGGLFFVLNKFGFFNSEKEVK